jgi:hypothetical protein
MGILVGNIPTNRTTTVVTCFKTEQGEGSDLDKFRCTNCLQVSLWDTQLLDQQRLLSNHTIVGIHGYGQSPGKHPYTTCMVRMEMGEEYRLYGRQRYRELRQTSCELHNTVALVYQDGDGTIGEKITVSTGPTAQNGILNH